MSSSLFAYIAFTALTIPTLTYYAPQGNLYNHHPLALIPIYLKSALHVFFNSLLFVISVVTVFLAIHLSHSPSIAIIIVIIFFVLFIGPLGLCGSSISDDVFNDVARLPGT